MPADGFDAEAAATAVRARYPDAKPLTLEEFKSRVVGRSFTVTQVSTGLTITSPRLYFHDDGTFQAGHRVIEYGTWTFEDGLAQLRSEKSKRAMLFFQSGAGIFYASVGNAQDVYSLNFGSPD